MTPRPHELPEDFAAGARISQVVVTESFGTYALLEICQKRG